METLMQPLSNWCAAHLHEIAGAFITTLLVVFGADINRKVRELIKKQHFLVRTLIFVLICGIGYGLLSVVATPYLARGLKSFGSFWLAPMTFLAFVALGFIAQRKRHI